MIRALSVSVSLRAISASNAIHLAVSPSIVFYSENWPTLRPLRP